MYTIYESKLYRKSFKRISRSPGFDRVTLDRVIDLLAAGKQLDKMYHDHPLLGDMKGSRECHLKNDLLLVYRIEKSELILALVDIGPHASVFS